MTTLPHSHVLAPILTLAALLLVPDNAAAAEQPAPRPTLSDKDQSRWSINFTPVLVAPHNEFKWGGGADPELKYTIDLGGARLSAGTRFGFYYAKNLFGATVMPTLRVMVPVGALEPY